jgi:hypothetical protein
MARKIGGSSCRGIKISTTGGDTIVNAYFQTALVTACLCLTLMFVPCKAPCTDYEFVTEMATSYLQTQNFSGISSLYLLPEHFSSQQKREEKNVISNALQFLMGEFGPIKSMDLNQDDILWFEFMVTVGDMTFLESRNDYFQRVFSADFETVGDGFVILQIFKDTEQPRLRGVGLALPATPDNAIVVQQIAEKLSQPN